MGPTISFTCVAYLQAEVWPCMQRCMVGVGRGDEKQDLPSLRPSGSSCKHASALHGMTLCTLHGLVPACPCPPRRTRYTRLRSIASMPASSPATTS